MKVGELKERLDSWPDDYEITFSGGLEFNRLKKRDNQMVNMEFHQIVHKDSSGEWVVMDPGE